MTFTVRWYLDEMARILDFDPDATGQDYHGGAADPWYTLKQGLTRAYVGLVQEAKQEVPFDYFRGVYRTTWPSGDVTLDLPEAIRDSAILTVTDVTTTEYGAELMVYERQRDGGLFWDDHRTLRWGISGPSSDVTLKFEYLMDGEDLSEDAQVPALVPARHRYALLWAALIECRSEVDEDTVPNSWRLQAQKTFENFIIDLAKGRMRSGNRSRMYDDNE